MPSSTSASGSERLLPADVLRRHGIRADKRLGQHFLLDPGILGRIAGAASPLAGRTVLEIGPGPGGLTAALLAAGAARAGRRRARRPVPSGPDGAGAAPSGPARDRGSRCARLRSGRACRPGSADRGRQPALQCRHRAPARLADADRAVRAARADVPEGGGAAACSTALEPRLRPARRAGATAVPGGAALRPAARRLHPTAQGELQRRPPHPARRPAGGRAS